MNGDNSEQISQESECRENAEYGIQERASAYAQRVVEEIEIHFVLNSQTHKLIQYTTVYVN